MTPPTADPGPPPASARRGRKSRAQIREEKEAEAKAQADAEAAKREEQCAKFTAAFGPILKWFTGALAKARECDAWAMDADQAETIAEATGRVLVKYIDLDAMTRWQEEIALGMVLVPYVHGAIEEEAKLAQAREVEAEVAETGDTDDADSSARRGDHGPDGIGQVPALVPAGS